MLIYPIYFDTLEIFYIKYFKIIFTNYTTYFIKKKIYSSPTYVVAQYYKYISQGSVKITHVFQAFILKKSLKNVGTRI